MLELGPYKPDATEDEAYYHADQHDMGATYSSSKTRGDSLGVGKNLFFAYNDVRYVFSAEKMWYWNSEGKYTGQRHPLVLPEDHPMSRDHYTNTLLILKMHYDRTISTASLAKIEEITDETGYIISKMARRGLGLAWWSKAIQGKKFYQFLWHVMEILSAVFVYLPMHFTLNKWANFGEEVEQEDYVPYPEGPRLQEQLKWKQWVSKAIYPAYALQLAGWQLYVVKGFPILRGIHEELFRLMIGKTNYVQQMLFGMKGISRERVESFQPMQGGRWGGYLNSRNDRNMRVRVPRPQYNNVDCDVARKLYNETQL